MNSKSINRNVWALTLSLCLGVIGFYTLNAQAAEERKGVAEIDGKPGHMPCPNPVNQTINVTVPTANNGDFTAAQWAARVGLNYTGTNKHFLGTFQWKPPHKCCQITRATLTVNMQANSDGKSDKSADAGNDGIAVMNAGSSVPPYSEAVYTGLWPFTKGKQVTKIWNLTGFALTKIENGGGLSFAVQDDTMVKSATLVLYGCCLTK